MLLRPVARFLLAVPFVYRGVQAVLHPTEHALAAQVAWAETTRFTPQAPDLSTSQLTMLVRAHGAATAVAGVLLALGKAPRFSALTLAGLTVPLAVADQPFTSQGPARSVRLEHFVTDLGAIGGALIAAVDTEGRPGLGYRVTHARETRAAIKAAVADATS